MRKKSCWGVVGEVVSAVFRGFVFVALLAYRPVVADAIGEIRYVNPTERTLGIGALDTRLLLGTTHASGAVWLIEIGERHLHGIVGLKQTSLRAAVGNAAQGLIVSSVWLRSPIGSELHAALEPFYWRHDRFAVSAVFNIHQLQLDGHLPVRLVTFGLRMSSIIPGGLAIGYSVDNIRVGGEAQTGLATKVYMVGGRNTPLSGVVGVEVDAQGAIYTNAASHVRLGGTLSASFGYTQQTETFNAAASFLIRPIRLIFGATHHPVLGLSKDIFLGWERGW